MNKKKYMIVGFADWLHTKVVLVFYQTDCCITKNF